VSRRPLSQSEDTRFGPEGIASNAQPAVSILTDDGVFRWIENAERGRRV